MLSKRQSPEREDFVEPPVKRSKLEAMTDGGSHSKSSALVKTRLVTRDLGEPPSVTTLSKGSATTSSPVEESKGGDDGTFAVPTRPPSKSSRSQASAASTSSSDTRMTDGTAADSADPSASNGLDSNALSSLSSDLDSGYDSDQTDMTDMTDMTTDDSAVTTVVVQFTSTEGTALGPQMALPVKATTDQLRMVVNKALENDHPYSFFLNDVEILASLEEFFAQNKTNTETVLSIVYQPQAVFRVRSVARCTATLAGHSEPILVVSFSPDGVHLATGSADHTVRLWDLDTETPWRTLKGHKTSVQTLAWAPNGRVLASGSNDGQIILWNPKTGKAIRKPLKGHINSCVMSLSWEPLHKNPMSDGLVSGGRDNLVKLWNTTTGAMRRALGGHTDAVMCVRWGGEGFIYSVSRDRTVRVWLAATGELKRILKGHAHWVNHCSLSTDYAMRTGWFDHTGKRPDDDKEALQRCIDRYNEARGTQGELLVTASDDATAYLWNPIMSEKPVQRLLGHQQVVNMVSFSPDGHYIATASFDKSVRLWQGRTGKFVATLRGHVGPVYQVCWSADSRLLVSASKDSTIKIWDVKAKKRHSELPGHADEVYGIDWSPNGERVASGGKDAFVKIWRR